MFRDQFVVITLFIMWMYGLLKRVVELVFYKLLPSALYAYTFAIDIRECVCVCNLLPVVIIFFMNIAHKY